MNSQKSFMNLVIFIALSFLLSGTILAQHQHGSDSTQTGKKKMNCCKTMSNSNQEMKSDSMQQHSIVREGEIDLKAIDKNKDGKVFQDPMDWNVISDSPGECPQCGMTLKEVSLDKAKENLLKHDYKVK